MKKVLFIDRDNTLIIEPPDKQIDSLEKLEFFPGIFYWLRKIAQETEYELVMVTNQDGLGTTSFPEEKFWPAHHKMLQAFSNEGIRFSKVYIDRSFEFENKSTRKPGIGMLTEFLTGQYDLKNSYVIGDRITDLELAKNLEAKGILLNNKSMQPTINERGLSDCCVLVTQSWEDIYLEVSNTNRVASVKRVTNETKISITLNLDGSGKTIIKTGIGFFNHMLEQIARHANLDLSIDVEGDLHIDEHHTIEDTGLVLGEAFLKALRQKHGIERYGYCLPMDDCLAQVALDFGGRPYLVWNADFSREKIGEMPTEMFPHFFKSFSDTAKCNLHIKAEGANEHHKIEAIFKAFAKSIKMAIKKDGYSLPSTKGKL